MLQTAAAILQHAAANISTVHCGPAGLHACVARPVVHSVDAEQLVLTLQKPLREAMTSPLIRWRLDRDEVASVYVQLRGNLLGEDWQLPKAAAAAPGHLDGAFAAAPL